MSMSIHKLMVDEGPGVHYEPAFLATIESHLTYLRQHPDSDYLQVEDGIAHKYEYDFYGLLKYLGVPNAHHWIVMRVNNYTAPYEYRSDKTEILLPSSEAVGQIRRLYRTMNKRR